MCVLLQVCGLSRWRGRALGASAGRSDCGEAALYNVSLTQVSLPPTATFGGQVWERLDLQMEPSFLPTLSDYTLERSPFGVRKQGAGTLLPQNWECFGMRKCVGLERAATLKPLPMSAKHLLRCLLRPVPQRHRASWQADFLA